MEPTGALSRRELQFSRLFRERQHGSYRISGWTLAELFLYIYLYVFPFDVLALRSFAQGGSAWTSLALTVDRLRGDLGYTGLEFVTLWVDGQNTGEERFRMSLCRLYD
jgi:hypothetical protein